MLNARTRVCLCMPVSWVMCTESGSVFLRWCMEKFLLPKNFPFTLKWIPALAPLPACIHPIHSSIHPSIYPSTSSLALILSLAFSFTIFLSCPLSHPYRHMHTSIWCVGQHTVLHISQTLSCHLLFLTPVKLFGEIFHTKRSQVNIAHTHTRRHANVQFHFKQGGSTGQQKHRIVVI